MASYSSVTVTINGTTYNLVKTGTSNGVETWSNDPNNPITAPATSSYSQATDHKYPVTVNAATLHGNTGSIDYTDQTLGSNLLLRVKEKTLPSITWKTGASYISANAKLSSLTGMKIGFTLSDSGSGVKSVLYELKNGSNTKIFDKTDLALAGQTSQSVIDLDASNRSNIDIILAETGVALLNDNYTFTATVTDYDDNVSTQSFTFKYDSGSPDVTVVSPSNNLYTNDGLTVEFSATDQMYTITASDLNVAVTDPGGTTTNYTPTYDPQALTYKQALTFSTAGTYTIVITATDDTGNTTTVTRTVYYDNSPVVFRSVTIAPNPADCGATLTITVEVE